MSHGILREAAGSERQEPLDVRGQAFFNENCDMVNRLIQMSRNETFALASKDFQSPTFYGELKNGDVKCLNYKLTHYYRPDPSGVTFQKRETHRQARTSGDVGRRGRRTVAEVRTSLQRGSCPPPGPTETGLATPPLRPFRLSLPTDPVGTRRSQTHRSWPGFGTRLMQKLWDQLVNAKHDSMLTLLTPKMDPFSEEAFRMTSAPRPALAMNLTRAAVNSED